MKRNAELQLLDWKSRSSRKPLIVRGARQVGKTWLVESFGKKQFDSMLSINLERQVETHVFFNRMEPNRIIQELSLYFKTPIRPGQTLLFLDEVQACPKAIACLRYFREEMPELHIVAAGSLLDVSLRDLSLSVPVGRIEYLFLNPLTFDEFLDAIGEDSLVNYLANYHMETEFSMAASARLSECLRLYFAVGGMPAAVAAYARQHDLLEVQRELASITTTIQDDFAKYGTRAQQVSLQQILRHIPRSIGRKIRYVNISRETRAEALRAAMERLELSRIVTLVRHSSANGVPIGAEASESHFKAILLDIGLCNNLCGLSLPESDKLLTVHEGRLAEQFIGQELRTQGPAFEDRPLYYWHREKQDANAEVDYLLANGEQVIPLEVRAGKSGSLKSTQVFLAEKKRHLAVRLNMDAPSIGTFRASICHEGRYEDIAYTLLSAPLYLVSQLRRLLQQHITDGAEFLKPCR